MNRTYAILISIMLTSVSMHGQTADQHNQEIQLEGGIKSDVTFLNFQKADAPGAVSQFTPGGSLGGIMNIWFKDWIGIQPELNLNFKQTVLGWEENSGRMLSFGIEVPIYAVARLDIFKDDHIFIGSGPFTEFICFAQWIIGDRNVDLLEIHESGEPMIQDTQTGFGAIIGYEFGSGLAIDVSYKLCCFNILQPNTSQGVSLYPQSVSIGLTYKFRKK